MFARINDTEVLSSHRYVVTVGTTMIGAFSEVTLPTLEIKTDTIEEGGLNDYVHIIASRRQKGVLTLKRGLVKGSVLLNWYQKMLDGDMKNAYQEVSVIVFDSMREVAEWWFFGRAFPHKWTAPQLKADQSAVAIESLELSVHDYERIQL
jgi:phage tail-like protein